MNVLVFTTLFPNNIETTKGVFVKERIYNLAKVVTITVVAPIRYIPFFGMPWHLLPIDDSSKNIYHPRYFVFPKILKWLDGLLLFLFCIPRMYKLIKYKKYDIIDAHWGYPDGFAAFLFSKLFNIPTVVTLRGSDVNVFLKSGMRKYIMLAYLKKLQKIIVVSNSLKKTLIKNGIVSSNIDVIRNGVALDRFTPVQKDYARRILDLNQNIKIILCIGNLVPVKGQDLLIDAYKNIYNSDLMLIFVGLGPMRNSLEMKIRNELSDSSNVLLAGQINHDDIPMWLNACDLYVLPSRSEGMPNVIYEAMACGKPVVATNVGDVAEILAHESLGIIVPPNDAAALGKAIITALGRSWDGDYIRESAKKYLWETTTQLCVKTWETLLSQRKI